jgi:hypothetical protein
MTYPSLLEKALNDIATPDLKSRCLEICYQATIDELLALSGEGLSDAEVSAQHKVLTKLARSLSSKREQVVAPKADQYVPRPSVTYSPPPEKTKTKPQTPSTCQTKQQLQAD